MYRVEEMILQLNPQLPIVVNLKGKWEKGYAFITIDYSQEHNLLFAVSLDSTGEIWIIPSNEVRFQNNHSLKRMRD